MQRKIVKIMCAKKGELILHVYPAAFKNAVYFRPLMQFVVLCTTVCSSAAAQSVLFQQAAFQVFRTVLLAKVQAAAAA